MSYTKYEDKELAYKGNATRMGYSYMNGKYVPYKFAIFEDAEGKTFEYKIDFKAKSSFALSINELNEGDKIVASFQGEQHYRKAKNGEREYYNKMTYVHLKEQEKEITEDIKDDISEEEDDRFIF